MSSIYKIVPAALLFTLCASASAYAQPHVEIRRSTYESADATYDAHDGADGCRRIALSVSIQNYEERLVNWSTPEPFVNEATVRFKVEDKCTPNARMTMAVYGRIPHDGQIARDLTTASVDLYIADAQARRCTELTPGRFTCEDFVLPITVSSDWLRTEPLYTDHNQYRTPVEGGWDLTQDWWSHAPTTAELSVDCGDYQLELSTDQGYIQRGTTHDLRYRN